MKIISIEISKIKGNNYFSFTKNQIVFDKLKIKTSIDIPDMLLDKIFIYDNTFNIECKSAILDIDLTTFQVKLIYNFTHEKNIQTFYVKNIVSNFKILSKKIDNMKKIYVDGILMIEEFDGDYNVYDGTRKLDSSEFLSKIKKLDLKSYMKSESYYKDFDILKYRFRDIKTYKEVKLFRNFYLINISSSENNEYFLIKRINTDIIIYKELYIEIENDDVILLKYQNKKISRKNYDEYLLKYFSCKNLSIIIEKYKTSSEIRNYKIERSNDVFFTLNIFPSEYTFYEIDDLVINSEITFPKIKIEYQDYIFTFQAEKITIVHNREKLDVEDVTEFFEKFNKLELGFKHFSIAQLINYLP